METNLDKHMDLTELGFDPINRKKQCGVTDAVSEFCNGDCSTDAHLANGLAVDTQEALDSVAMAEGTVDTLSPSDHRSVLSPSEPESCSQGQESITGIETTMDMLAHGDGNIQNSPQLDITSVCIDEAVAVDPSDGFSSELIQELMECVAPVSQYSCDQAENYPDSSSVTKDIADTEFMAAENSTNSVVVQVFEGCDEQTMDKLLGSPSIVELPSSEATPPQELSLETDSGVTHCSQDPVPMDIDINPADCVSNSQGNSRSVTSGDCVLDALCDSDSVKNGVQYDSQDNDQSHAIGTDSNLQSDSPSTAAPVSSQGFTNIRNNNSLKGLLASAISKMGIGESDNENNHNLMMERQQGQHMSHSKHSSTSSVGLAIGEAYSQEQMDFDADDPQTSETADVEPDVIDGSEEKSISANDPVTNTACDATSTEHIDIGSEGQQTDAVDRDSEITPTATGIDSEAKSSETIDVDSEAKSESCNQVTQECASSTLGGVTEPIDIDALDDQVEEEDRNRALANIEVMPLDVNFEAEDHSNEGSMDLKISSISCQVAGEDSSSQYSSESQCMIVDPENVEATTENTVVEGDSGNGKDIVPEMETDIDGVEGSGNALGECKVDEALMDEILTAKQEEDLLLQENAADVETGHINQSDNDVVGDALLDEGDDEDDDDDDDDDDCDDDDDDDNNVSVEDDNIETEMVGLPQDDDDQIDTVDIEMVEDNDVIQPKGNKIMKAVFSITKKKSLKQLLKEEEADMDIERAYPSRAHLFDYESQPLYSTSSPAVERKVSNLKTTSSVVGSRTSSTDVEKEQDPVSIVQTILDGVITAVCRKFEVEHDFTDAEAAMLLDAPDVRQARTSSTELKRKRSDDFSDVTDAEPVKKSRLDDLVKALHSRTGIQPMTDLLEEESDSDSSEFVAKVPKEKQKELIQASVDQFMEQNSQLKACQKEIASLQMQMKIWQGVVTEQQKLIKTLKIKNAIVMKVKSPVRRHVGIQVDLQKMEAAKAFSDKGVNTMPMKTNKPTHSAPAPSKPSSPGRSVFVPLRPKSPARSALPALAPLRPVSPGRSVLNLPPNKTISTSTAPAIAVLNGMRTPIQPAIQPPVQPMNKRQRQWFEQHTVRQRLAKARSTPAEISKTPGTPATKAKATITAKNDLKGDIVDLTDDDDVMITGGSIPAKTGTVLHPANGVFIVEQIGTNLVPVSIPPKLPSNMNPGTYLLTRTGGQFLLAPIAGSPTPPAKTTSTAVVAGMQITGLPNAYRGPRPISSAVATPSAPVPVGPSGPRLPSRNNGRSTQTSRKSTALPPSGRPQSDPDRGRSKSPDVIITTISKQAHPAPLPPLPPQPPAKLEWKDSPPKPVLKISNATQGIVLSWTLHQDPKYELIDKYQIFAYQESSNGPVNSQLWKKVGDVKALPLPMACTLTQFQRGHKYHFSVRAIDIHSRPSPYSTPMSIEPS